MVYQDHLIQIPADLEEMSHVQTIYGRESRGHAGPLRFMKESGEFNYDKELAMYYVIKASMLTRILYCLRSREVFREGWSRSRF